jgi:hypothetical protein
MCRLVKGHRFELLHGPYPLYQCLECRLAIEIRKKDDDHIKILEKYPSCEEIRARLLERHPREPEPDLEKLKADAERLGLTLEDVKHWWAAVVRWRRAGKPVRTDAKVAAILEVCQSCKHFHNGRCRKCRCRVNAGKIPLFNKLRMATEGCPDGRFGPDC